MPRAVTVLPTDALAGRVALPADKSIAHRALLLAALASGETEIVGASDAADPQATLACLRALGVEVEPRGEGDAASLVVQGMGGRFQTPAGPLDCANSGTTMRLLTGLLAAQPFDSVLVGDSSLSRRPMARVAEPLRQMGAEIVLDEGHAPMRIRGGRLRGIEYRLPVASAQVKSAVLLAGLLAEGSTVVVETTPTRDHTERMLGLDTFEMGGERRITVEGGRRVPSGLWVVPKDFSAAAFFLVAASTAAHAAVELMGVGLNPSRTALLDVLRAMGARVDVASERVHGREPLGDLRAYGAPAGLAGVTVSGPLTAALIDELPALAVAAALAEGTTEIRDAAELRHKESDRLAATAAFLTAMGADVDEHADGLTIRGGRPLRGAVVDARGDHRIAMAAAVAALSAKSATTIHGADSVAVSFPGFWDALASVGAQVEDRV